MLLALLVLSALLAISFSLATVLLVEIKSSGDLTRSEASLYASTGVSEQALFDLKRQVSCSGGCSYITNFSNNVTLNGQPVVSSVSSPTFTDTIKQNTSFASNPKIYDFCNTNSGNSGCGYGKVTVTYLPNGNHDPLVVYLCQYDPTILYTDMPPCSGTAEADAPYWITTKYGDTDAGPYYPKGTLIYSTSLPGQTTWNIDPSLQQRLILFNPNSTGPIYVSIQTFAADGTTPLGLPYAGVTSVTVNTKNGDVGRKLQVLVPVSNSSTSSVSPAALINSGGGAYSGSGSKNWAADNSFSGGSIYSVANSISNTSDQTLYQAQRFGNFTYTISGLTPNSSHTVILKFSEIYWSSPWQREFNVQINGSQVLTNFDIVADAGSNFKADDKSFSATADSSGNISIQFVTIIDNAEINAIEVD